MGRRTADHYAYGQYDGQYATTLPTVEMPAELRFVSAKTA
jgi:hypothetical protein